MSARHSCWSCGTCPREHPWDKSRRSRFDVLFADPKRFEGFHATKHFRFKSPLWFQHWARMSHAYPHKVKNNSSLTSLFGTEIWLSNENLHQFLNHFARFRILSNWPCWLYGVSVVQHIAKGCMGWCRGTLESHWRIYSYGPITPCIE